MAAHADRKIIIDQVRRLVVIPPASAPEGVIFYCARMLDGMCAGLIARLGQKPSPNIFSNLMTIEAHRLIDTIGRELAHTLRRMGNGVRHTLDNSTEDDTKLAMVLVREMLRWYESLEPGDEFAGALGRLDDRIDPSWSVVALVDLLTGIEEGKQAAIEALVAQRKAALSSRFLAMLCAESLIACGRAKEAGELLADCAATFGSDQRHQQLAALVLSRTGRLEEAVEAAAQLLRRYPKDDETAGIAGGIYKRRWDRDSSQVAALKKAHELYRDQWKEGAKINAYLGVNAAATAVYRGEIEAARAIAADVVAAMDRRDGALRSAELAPQDGGLAEYYDRVSRAEALLIAGEEAAAEAAYEASYQAYPWLGGAIDGTKAQAGRIQAALRRYGETAAAAAALAAAPRFALGVTGHRPHKLNAARLAIIDGDLRRVLGAVAERLAPRRFACISALAEGADTMAAEAALALGWALEAPLPFPLKDYAKDFSGGAIKALHMLARKAQVSVCTPDRAALADETEGYLAASTAMLDGADALVAVWDGTPTALKAGAYDTLMLGLERGLPVLWIDAQGERPPLFLKPEDRPLLARGERPPERIEDDFLAALD